MERLFRVLAIVLGLVQFSKPQETQEFTNRNGDDATVTRGDVYAGPCKCTDRRSFCADDKGKKVDCDHSSVYPDTMNPRRFGYCHKMVCEIVEDGEAGAERNAAASGCFPASASVRRYSTSGLFEEVSVASVMVGDTLQAVNSTGDAVESKVSVLLHAVPDEHIHLRLQLSGGGSLELSPNHLVPVLSGDGEGGSGDAFSSAVYKYAEQVQIGDTLWAVGRGPVDVVEVEAVARDGAFAPVTEQGTIVVGGVAASCYAEAYSHSVAHTAMSALQVLAGLLGLPLSADTLSGDVSPLVSRFQAAAHKLLPSSFFYSQTWGGTPPQPTQAVSREAFSSCEFESCDSEWRELGSQLLSPLISFGSF